MQRREFLKSAAALGISATAPVLAQSRPNASPTPSAIQRPQSPDMIYRQLGTDRRNQRPDRSRLTPLFRGASEGKCER